MNRKSYVGFQNMPSNLTLSDLEGHSRSLKVTQTLMAYNFRLMKVKVTHTVMAYSSYMSTVHGPSSYSIPAWAGFALARVSLSSYYCNNNYHDMAINMTTI